MTPKTMMPHAAFPSRIKITSNALVRKELLGTEIVPTIKFSLSMETSQNNLITEHKTSMINHLNKIIYGSLYFSIVSFGLKYLEERSIQFKITEA